ncbi:MULTISPECIES: M48 family metallopeptidase [Streptomyces]|uniref:M48 family metallopeptidase n=2 Tax=Streptomyces TaxID=1883 RepID=A0ABU4K3J8_9ACTN|nr:M48 family metallopeptidase [Streptomyces roseolus]MDX2292144.1 M48 family metallopeptidase [Streptomyces roseolus]
MTETVDERRAADTGCPDCGTALTGGGAYVAWCAGCGWNTDPGATEEAPPAGRIDRVRRRLAHRYGEQLFADLTASGGPGEPGPSDESGEKASRAGRGRSGWLATCLALAVHGLTLALLGGGIAMIAAGQGLVPVLGALPLLVALVLRPRLGSLRKTAAHLPVLRRADAPELFGLLDDVAAAVGTTGVEAVVVDADVNASVRTYGIRRQRVLTVGLGLWETLSPQERVVLLGHEFGHYAHGDTRHALVVSTAFQSLDTWSYTLAPQPSESLLDDLTNLATALPRMAVDGVAGLLDHLTLRGAQRAEYLADEAAARTGGSRAAAALMDRLLSADAVAGMLRREAVAARTRRTGARSEDAAEGLWQRLAAQAGAVPASEYERLRRVAELRGHSVDSTHPPTHLRHRLLAAGAFAPRIVLDAERAARVDAELGDARRTLARELLLRG